jgi:sugar phosphate isomerase/epimerase
MPAHSRRQFLQLSALAAAAVPALHAIQPFARKGEARMRLSLAAYSFRDFLPDWRHPQKTPREPAIDLFKFIDFCAAHGCAGTELTSYFFPHNPTDSQLRDIRRHAFLSGVTISGTSVGNNFAMPRGPALDAEIADVKKWIDRAAVLGAPHIRLFAGPEPKGADLTEIKRNCIAAIETCCAYAGERGIFLGLENHGGIVAQPEQLLEIIRSIDSPWLGINLDTGNFHVADPYAALEACAPYAVNVQVKLDIRPGPGKTPQPADFPRIVEILRKARYQGWVVLEYESAEDPWKAVPPALAQLSLLLAGAAAPSASQPLFDGQSLKGWKVTDYGARGEVTVSDGRIVLDAGDPLTGITLDGEPPARMNYEITLEAMKLSGDDFFCALTLPVGDACGTLVVGGWGGSLVGFSSIDELDASENSTTQFKKFDPNQWYRLRVRVTPERLQFWIDDEPFIDTEIAGKKIGMRLGEIEMSQPLGLTSFRTRAALRNIHFRRL